MPAEVGLVVDCNDPEALAEFWAAALGYANIGPAGNYVVLYPDGGPGPRLLLQKVPEPKVGKNRVHFDIEIADIEAEATRLESLGARRLQPDTHREFGISWIVMSDPEGNEFCVCAAVEGASESG